MDCEAWMPPTQITAAITKAHNRSATLLTTREQCGAGWSVRLSWRTCAFTATLGGPLRFLNQWPNIFLQRGWEPSARFSMAKHHLRRAGHLRRPGVWQKPCARGGLAMTPA